MSVCLPVTQLPVASTFVPTKGRRGGSRLTHALAPAWDPPARARPGPAAAQHLPAVLPPAEFW